MKKNKPKSIEEDFEYHAGLEVLSAFAMMGLLAGTAKVETDVHDLDLVKAIAADSINCAKELMRLLEEEKRK